jgi:hypothetical protein
MTRKVEIETCQVCDHYAVYLMYGDPYDLSEGEIKQIDDFLSRHKPYSHLDCEFDGDNFRHCEITGLLANCMTLKFVTMGEEFA